MELSGAALASKAADINVTEDIVAKLKTFMMADGTFKSTIGSKGIWMIYFCILYSIFKKNAAVNRL